MKIISKFLIFLSIAGSLVSCKKFLEIEPQTSISDDNTIVDGVSAETAVRGIYNAVGRNGYYGYNFQNIAYFSGDNVVYLGPQIQNRQFTDHSVRSDNSVIGDVWLGIYNVINRANHVIEKVPAVPTDGSFTQAKKDQLLGEAYFLRALAYFDLARTWGGVQLILTPTTSISGRGEIKRSSLNDTYAQVLKDLEDAEKLLPTTVNRVRATQKTAWALKARYFLYQQQWEQAELYASKVIADGVNYKLNKPYSSFFANNARATQESVFELYYSSTLTNSLASEWQPTVNGGTGRIGPSNAFVSLANDPSIGGSRNALLTQIDIVSGGNTQTTWWGKLYYRNPGTDPVYIIRIAELYLIRAEARAQQTGKLADARYDLDAVRDRAGLTGSTATTKEAILLAIEDERRVEFAFEAHRWFDLVRTGRAGVVLGVTDSRKYVLPLPANELGIDDALEQNDGYAN